MHEQDWLTPEERDQLDRTVQFAVEKHRRGYRKGNCLPYITHPFDVMSQLADWGILCLPTWQIALCHDIPEDCPQTTRAELVKATSDFVADRVYELTFVPQNNGVKDNLQKAEYMKGWLKRLPPPDDNPDAIIWAKSVESLVVKVADRCCNVWDFTRSGNHAYAKKYCAKAETLFDAMMSRHQQITDRYGEGVFVRMKHTRQTLLSQII